MKEEEVVVVVWDTEKKKVENSKFKNNNKVKSH